MNPSPLLVSLYLTNKLMPPKKRTSQSKRTPPTSPTTSTPHVPADHHHLRHTGPSISTRAGVAASSKPPVQPELTSEKKPLAEVSPPSTRTSFTKFINVVLFLALLLLGWYVYGMVTLLGRLKDEIGWWGIVVGDSGGVARWGTLKGRGIGSDRSGEEGGAGADKSDDLEGSLNALADALGIPPVQVASAVKSLIPRASLTSIASKTEETGASEAVRILLEDTTRDSRDNAGIAEEFSERLGRGAAEEDLVEGSVV
ncbi:hypothetical protein J3R83DRAFT_9160 [Lanmaoa asiatica]|nr:hypothetical protein J3R83DRAFT_9160 [Lanmaoa asiatica]